MSGLSTKRSCSSGDAPVDHSAAVRLERLRTKFKDIPDHLKESHTMKNIRLKIVILVVSCY